MKLSAEQLARWNADGFLAIRSAFTEQELSQIGGAVASHYERGDFEYGVSRQPSDPPERTTKAGKELGAGNFPLGFARVLANTPEIARLTCGHHKLLPAVEQLLGASVTVSQFIHTLRTPGSTGTGTHFDYKPWRPVGSFLDWCFAVIPLVDYTNEIGPLLVAPGSHKLTKVLSSDGRVHPVAAAQVPSGPIHLLDPELRRGDLFIFHMFCWHKAHGANQSSTLDRTGMYIKFHATHAPPATGPLIFPSVAHLALAAAGLPDERNPIRHHRADGRYWGRSDGESVHLTIDTVQLLLETVADDESARDSRFLLVRNTATGVWSLPEAIAAEDPDAGNDWDSGNHIGCMTAHMHDLYGLKIPWMSWLDDYTAKGGHDGKMRQLEKRISVCRVYAHRLCHTVPIRLLRNQSTDTRWVTIDELGALSHSSLRYAGLEARWAMMWTTETDAAGAKVMRGFGVANHRMRYLRFQAPPQSRGDGTVSDHECRFIVNADSLQAVARM